MHDFCAKQGDSVPPDKAFSSRGCKCYMMVRSAGLACSQRRTSSDIPVVGWEEDHGMCLQRRKYVAAIFGAGVPLLQLYPTAARNMQAQIMVGFPRSTCSAMTQSSIASCSGDLEKSILLLWKSLLFTMQSLQYMINSSHHWLCCF